MSSQLEPNALLTLCKNFEHDMQTPLLTLLSLNRKLNEFLPAVLEAYAKNETSDIPAKNLAALEKLPQSYDLTLEKLNKILNEFLIAMKNVDPA